MKRIKKNGIEILQFEQPGFIGCQHAIFTRKGGVSVGQYTSLNQGGTVGDKNENVVENRKRAFDFCKRSIESIFDVWQVHSTTVICTDRPRASDEPHLKADAIFTDNPKITLFMRFADCVPILLFDPVKRVVGIIHAGWKGTVDNIVGNAIDTIQKKYQVNPDNLIAGIGPAIGPDHYIVGDEVREQAEVTFRNNGDQFLIQKDKHTYFDLWAANKFLLHEKGIKSIESAEICTACHLDDWYSHRAEKGATGRFGALIAIGNDNG